MDLAIIVAAFFLGVTAGAWAVSLGFLVFHNADKPTAEVAVPTTPLYKPVDRSDKAVARMERGRNVAQGPNGSTTVFEMQAGPR